MPEEVAAEAILPELLGAGATASTIGPEVLAAAPEIGAASTASTIGPEVLAAAPEMGAASGVGEAVASGLTPEAAAVPGPSLTPGGTAPGANQGAPGAAPPVAAAPAALGAAPGGFAETASTFGPEALSFDAGSPGPTSGFGGSGGVPGVDYSAYTGEAPTDVPNPVPDETVAPATSTNPDMLQKLLAKITGNPLTAGALGLNAVSALSQRNSAKQVPAQLKAIGQPAADVSNSLLADYQAGRVAPGADFDINKWEQQQIAAANSYYSRAGMPDSTAKLAKIRDIQAQAQSLRDKSRAGLLDGGLKALGIAQGPLSSAVTAQASQDQAFMQSQGQALQALMLLQAMQNKGAPVAA